MGIHIQQSRNTRSVRMLSFQGETLCLSEWAERIGIKPKTLRARIDDHGWTIEKALTVDIMTPAEAQKLGVQSRLLGHESGHKKDVAA
jgi:uncharacterized protein YjcR